MSSLFNIFFSKQLVGICIGNNTISCSYVFVKEKKINIVIERVLLDNLEIYNGIIYNYKKIFLIIDRFLKNNKIIRPEYFIIFDDFDSQVRFDDSSENISCSNIASGGNIHDQSVYIFDIFNFKVKYITSVGYEKLIQVNVLSKTFNLNVFAISTKFRAIYHLYLNFLRTLKKSEFDKIQYNLLDCCQDVKNISNYINLEIYNLYNHEIKSDIKFIDIDNNKLSDYDPIDKNELMISNLGIYYIWKDNLKL